jgi:transforming growth factor-beta-induced protein
LTDATIFAPTDDAFAALIGEDGLNVEFSALTKAQLGPILAYHVITSGAVDGETALGLTKATTLGGDITLEAKDGGLVIDGSANVDLSSEGASYDIETCQGLVHVIDAVLVPSVADIVTSDFGSTGDYKGLYDTTGAATSTETIVGALETTDNITVFAPTNDAFDALASVPEADALDEIIQYHVHPGMAPVYAADALGLTNTEIDMLAGGKVSVDGNAGAGPVTLTDGSAGTSEVVVTDVYASNGVIHRVNAVLIPASE